MAKRLQVILQDPEYREIQRAAKANHLSIAAWVRQALASARRREPAAYDPAKKIAAVRLAARQAYPTADIDSMLTEIEAGYRVADRK